MGGRSRALATLCDSLEQGSTETSTIAKRAKEAIDEAASPEQDKAEIAHKTNRLKQAAENIREVMPAVFGIAVTIVGSLLKLGS